MSLCFKIGGSQWSAKLIDGEKFLSVTHKMLAQTQRWARNCCSAETDGLEVQFCGETGMF